MTIIFSKLLLQKKASWTILILFFIYDNLFSYYAITRLGGHEVNHLISRFVEKYPLLYFLCIPGTILIAVPIVWALKQIAVKILKRFEFTDTKIIERIVLNSLVIYWAIANSFVNVTFMLGYRLPHRTWGITSIVGSLTASLYALLIIFFLHKKKSTY